MDYCIVVAIGAVIGSFLNVCISRISREESIIYPPSHCEKCQNRLSPLELIPIFSYIFLRGRCSHCKSTIEKYYTVIEISNLVLYLLIYYKFGLSILTLKYFILTSLLIVIAMIDYKTQFVYTSTTILGSIIGIIFIIIQAFMYDSGAINFILGGLIGFFIISTIIFITRGMGTGDAEIAVVCGLFLGAKGVLVGLLLAIIIGGIIGIIILALGKKDLKEKIAFGPFIAFGTILSMLYCNEIIIKYLELFNI